MNRVVNLQSTIYNICVLFLSYQLSALLSDI